MVKTDLILALSRCSFLKTREKQTLAKKLDSLGALTVLSINELQSLTGRPISPDKWTPESLKAAVERDFTVMEAYSISLTAIMSNDFPPQLREIPDPPFSLFYRGALPESDKPLVAMVGTRSPTGEGIRAALRIAGEFGSRGFAVVSGLARGIDAYAHKGNLDAGGKTVAVLASGLDRIYPRSNARLAGRILDEGGCLISEYSPGESPHKYRFPQRNRIISGLSRGILVIEAPEKSGALITADFALEQGRDIVVYEGTLDSSKGAGVGSLYSQGAPAIKSADELLESWGYALLNERSQAPVFGTPSGFPQARGSLPVRVGRQLALDFLNELSLRKQ